MSASFSVLVPFGAMIFGLFLGYVDGRRDKADEDGAVIKQLKARQCAVVQQSEGSTDSNVVINGDGNVVIKSRRYSVVCEIVSLPKDEKAK